MYRLAPMEMRMMCAYPSEFAVVLSDQSFHLLAVKQPVSVTKLDAPRGVKILFRLPFSENVPQGSPLQTLECHI